MCRICGRCCHTRPRAILHLQSSSTNCWVPTMRRYEPLSVEATQALDAQDRSLKQAHHQRGLRLQEDDKIWRPACEEELAGGLVARDNPVEAEGPATDSEMQEWSRLGLLPPGRGGRPSTQRGGSATSVCNIMDELRLWESRHKREALAWEPNMDWVPRPFSSGEKFALILFSGHRRDGDIATWLSRLGGLTPICVDMAVDPEVGNIFHNNLWVRLIRARRILAAHAGPPCETYLLARWIPVEDGAGPRPLRSSTHPWGLPDRTEKEVKQCHIGTALMLQALKLLLLAWCHGAAITLEHPKGPSTEDDIYWCIWFSTFIRQWMLAPQVNTVTFLQGPLGQISPKPTTLLAARLPGLPARIYAAYQRHWTVQHYLGGRAATGEWKTARAKAYPEALCQVLAEEYTLYPQYHLEEAFDEVPEDVRLAIDRLSQWDPYLLNSSAGVMAADYHPDAFG
eukprot:Skav214598  [mRNA]  locus=scaffold57:531067:532428:+ [translate_table: standard]